MSAQTFVDPRLGEFSAHDTPRQVTAWRNWTGALSRGNATVSLGLGGDGRGPHQWLLAELRNIVAHLDAIEDRAAKALAECAPHYDIAQFHMASIVVWDEVDSVFEITFEAADPEARANVETAWPPGRVVYHRIVIARDYRGVYVDGQLRLAEPRVPSDYPG